MSASSESNAADLGRLNHNKHGSAWSAGTNDDKQWLQIDLGNPNTVVTRAATQGRNAHNQWVTTYSLQFSGDGLNFQYYKEQGQTEKKVMKYNMHAL